MDREQRVKTVRLSIFRHDIERLLRQLTEYLATSERAIHRSEKENLKYLADSVKTMPQCYDDQLGADFAEHEEFFKKTYPDNLRYSFLFLLMMFIETRLTELCRILAAGHKTCFDPKDRGKKSVLEWAKVYIAKVLAIMPMDSANWEPITCIQKVRNVITHANGVVKDSEDEKYVRDQVNKNIGLHIGPDDKLNIAPNFCYTALDSVLEFFKSIFNAERANIRL